MSDFRELTSHKRQISTTFGFPYSLLKAINDNNTQYHSIPEIIGTILEPFLLYFYFLVCPSKVKLNCANVMYSKPCRPNYDCSHAGWQFVCCESGCTGDTQFVCVPGGIEWDRVG